MNGGDVEKARKIIDGRMESLTDGNFALIYDSAVWPKYTHPTASGDGS